MKLPRNCLLGFLVPLALAEVLNAQSFTVIGIPDTQNYSEFYPAIYAQQTAWVVSQIAPRNIAYVSHYGDVVNHGDRINEWIVADAAMSTLDAANIPYGVTAGNHDITPSGVSGSNYIPAYFLNYFGPSRFAGRSWYGGASPSGMSSYQTFTAGGMEFLALHIECDGALRELKWAQGVLNDNRDKPVMMTTHRYLQDAEDYTSGVPLVPSGRYPSIWYSAEGVYAPDGIESDQIFDWFVRRNPNIFIVQCGHFHEEFRQTSTNVRGNPVHEVLADYQDDPNGGDGWLRIMQFDLGANRVDVESYSPYLNAFRTAGESKFSLPVTFQNYRETNPTVVLQQDIGGYLNTHDTWISQASPNSSYGNNDVRVSDDDVNNSIFSDAQGQALIRFDGLVGPGGTSRIPLGSTIVSAHLTIQIADDIDNPLYDPDFLVHRVLVPWSESSTWNSLGNGLQQPSDLSPVIASFSGDNNPNEDGLRRIQVTAAVQAWADGAANHGFAILPEIINGNDDGIEILTSESANALLRPSIEVVFVPPPAGIAFCTGDGSGTDCPCSNNSAPGLDQGCRNSTGSGARLSSSGLASLAHDSLQLIGTGMPNGTSLFLQGTAMSSTPGGALLGDGLLCIGSSLVRLGVKTNSNGGSRLPEAGDPAISVKGAIAAPGERFYQQWYRDPSNFCTPLTYNLTQGLRVIWQP